MILPLVGRHLAVRKNSQDCLRGFYAGCRRLDEHLRKRGGGGGGEGRDFLVGDRLTLADVFVVGEMLFGVRIFHQVLAAEYPALLRWFHGVHEQPLLRDVVGEFSEIKLPIPELEERS